jgi:hypothetical protein
MSIEYRSLYCALHIGGSRYDFEFTLGSCVKLPSVC